MNRVKSLGWLNPSNYFQYYLKNYFRVTKELYYMVRAKSKFMRGCYFFCGLLQFIWWKNMRVFRIFIKAFFSTMAYL